MIDFTKYTPYVNVCAAKAELYTIKYMDFDYDSLSQVSESVITQDDNHPTTTVVGTVKLFFKCGVLIKTDEDINKLLVENIISLSNITTAHPPFHPKLSVKDDNIDVLIRLAVSYVALNGRIGPAKNMLISEQNYKKYNLQETCDSLNLTVLFDESVNDLYLYRINDLNHPGLSLIYFNDKYDLVTLGLYPEKQFVKIEL